MTDAERIIALERRVTELERQMTHVYPETRFVGCHHDFGPLAYRLAMSGPRTCRKCGAAEVPITFTSPIA